MVDHLLRLKPARAFPSEVEDMVQQVAEIRREFLTSSMLTSQPVRNTIRESWLRCMMLIDPGRDKVPVIITSEADLDELRSSNEIFLKATSTVIKRLTHTFAGSGYVIGLADAKGRLLQVSGDKNTLQWMEQIGLAPGGDWSEANAGTNGIGTALAVGHAVRVVGPEHYCDGWQDITCITVPIRDPWKGEIAGVLDISGDYHLVRPFFTSILSVAAMEIKENLKALQSPYPHSASHFQVSIPLIHGGRDDNVSAARALHSHSARLIPSLANTYQAQLVFQEQRAITAERLAIAVGMVSASLDVETTLTQVAEQAAYILGLDHVGVCFWEDLKSGCSIRTWSNSSTPSCNIYEVVSALAAQPDTTNLLCETGEPIVIDDVRSASRFISDKIGQNGIGAIAILPLLKAQSVDGFIVLTHTKPYRWQADDLRLELTFAFHAATAIENARLYQELQHHHRHVQALNAVNQLLHSLYDPIQQLDLVIGQIIEIMGMDGGMILLKHGNSNEPILAAYSGVPESCLTNLYHIACENASLDNTLILSRKDHKHSRISKILHNLGLHQVLIAPLLAKSDVLGNLLVSSRQTREISSDEIILFTNICQQLGQVLQNAQLLHLAGETHALREADRIKSHFLMMISHDLRSPLTAIRTSIESLMDEESGHSASTQKHLLGNIASQAKRLGGLVDQLLDLTRIEAGALTLDRDWTELACLITDTVKKFERLNAPFQVSLSIAAHIPLVYVDPERIVQVLWNLLDNAHKYAAPRLHVSVDVFTSGREVILRVADEGPGIPMEEREKIFQNFYRLTREKQMHTPGSGLGLAICRGIMDAHGGRIWVEDGPEGGSVFVVTIPPSLTDSDDLIALENLDPIGVFRN